MQAFSSTSRFTLSTSTNHYIAVITRQGSVAGNIATLLGVPVITSVQVTFRIDVFLASNNTSTATDCTTTGTRICRMTVTLHLAGNASNNPIAQSDNANLSAGSAVVAVVPPCAVPFATFNGGSASVPGLTIHFTT